MTSEIARIIVEINRWGTAILLAEQNARLALRLSRIGYVFRERPAGPQGRHRRALPGPGHPEGLSFGLKPVAPRDFGGQD